MRLRHALALGALGLASLSAQSAPAPAVETITELRFNELFGPIGDRGLEYSEKLRGLAGRRVQLRGFMVRDAEHAPGIFVFAGWPVTVERSAFCAQDDTPPSAVHVHVPTTRAIPFRPGALTLVGTLELGPRAEADGRNSFVRLVLDAATTRELFGGAVPVAVTP